jgi:hypothetical protein
MTPHLSVSGPAADGTAGRPLRALAENQGFTRFRAMVQRSGGGRHLSGKYLPGEGVEERRLLR